MRIKTIVFLALAIAVALGLFAAGGDDSATVVRVVDGDTLKVTIGGKAETIRLLGVDTPELGDARKKVEQFAEKASEFTRRLADGRKIRLESDPEADNRGTYGRLLRYVYLPDGRMLNATLIREGYGFAMTRYPFSKRSEFRALEREARLAGRGLWGDGSRGTVEAGSARDHLGEVVTVCGDVRSTKYARTSRHQPTYLNLGRPYPDQWVTIVIFGADRDQFDEPERLYDGKRICVSGKLESFRGTPQVAVHDPSQIVIEVE